MEKAKAQAKRLKIKVKNHLLIPFGVTKWEVDAIKMSGISTEATYFESESPMIYIDKNLASPLTLKNVEDVFPISFPEIEDGSESYEYLKSQMKRYTDKDTEFENRFLDLYFELCSSNSITFQAYWLLKSKLNRQNQEVSFEETDPNIAFDALLPIPQAQLYVEDLFEESYNFNPENMVVVDFLFWTGQKLVAVEIDSMRRDGEENQLSKDRMLKRAGIDVIHILGREIIEYGVKAVGKLLPQEITNYWQYVDIEHYAPTNPLSSPYLF